MALRVLCPGGCRLQVPKSRAGMMVRCPKCSKIIRIAKLASASEGEDGMQLLTATIPSVDELASYRAKSGLVKQPKVRKKVVREPQSKSSDASDSRTRSKNRIEPESTAISTETDEAGRRRWRLPGEKSEYERKEALRRKRKATKRKVEPKQADTPKSLTDPTEPPVESAVKLPSNSAVDSPRENKSSDRVPQHTRESGQTVATNEADVAADEVLIAGVTHDRQSKLRSVFCSITLVLIGIFLIIPAVNPFVEYVRSGSQTRIHAWAAWLVFASLLQFVYAVFVVQLADWTSMWCVAIAMLVATVISAFLLAGIALSPPGGFVSQLFQIPNSQTTRAEIWLMMLLLIVSMVGWLSGREAFRWKRQEDLVRQKDAATA